MMKAVGAPAGTRTTLPSTFYANTCQKHNRQGHYAPRPNPIRAGALSLSRNTILEHRVMVTHDTAQQLDWRVVVVGVEVLFHYAGVSWIAK